MGDILRWVMEQKSCEIRIQQLDSALCRWEAEEAALRQFRGSAEETQGELAERNSVSLQAAGDLENMAETCRTAGICGSNAGGETGRVGRGLAEMALTELQERIDRELHSYEEKMDSARKELRHARARREQLEQMIREDSEG